MTIDFLIVLFLVGSPAAVLVLLLLYGLHRSRRREVEGDRHGRRFEVLPPRDTPRDGPHGPSIQE